jgi:hypothetical protein
MGNQWIQKEMKTPHEEFHKTKVFTFLQRMDKKLLIVGPIFKKILFKIPLKSLLIFFHFQIVNIYLAFPLIINVHSI